MCFGGVYRRPRAELSRPFTKLSSAAVSGILAMPYARKRLGAPTPGSIVITEANATSARSNDFVKMSDPLEPDFSRFCLDRRLQRCVVGPGLVGIGGGLSTKNIRARVPSPSASSRTWNAKYGMSTSSTMRMPARVS